MDANGAAFVTTTGSHAFPPKWRARLPRCDAVFRCSSRRDKPLSAGLRDRRRSQRPRRISVTGLIVRPAAPMTPEFDQGQAAEGERWPFSGSNFSKSRYLRDLEDAVNVNPDFLCKTCSPPVLDIRPGTPAAAHNPRTAHACKVAAGHPRSHAFSAAIRAEPLHHHKLNSSGVHHVGQKGAIFARRSGGSARTAVRRILHWMCRWPRVCSGRRRNGSFSAPQAMATVTNWRVSCAGIRTVCGLRKLKGRRSLRRRRPPYSHCGRRVFPDKIRCH